VLFGLIDVLTEFRLFSQSSNQCVRVIWCQADRMKPKLNPQWAFDGTAAVARQERLSGLG
jgi:hypothetical protein